MMKTLLPVLAVLALGSLAGVEIASDNRDGGTSAADNRVGAYARRLSDSAIASIVIAPKDEDKLVCVYPVGI